MRLQGWERRLDAVIEEARARPYVLGEHDCFRVACRVIEALTGVDRWPEFHGYRTRREALLRIAQYGGTFTGAGDLFFGGPSIDVRLARRGDIVAFVAPADAEHHLGVVTGKNFLGLGEGGLVELPVLSARCAWRVG